MPPSKKPGVLLEVLRSIARPLFGKGYWGKPGLRTIATWFRRTYRPEYVVVAGSRLYLNHADPVLNSYIAVTGHWEKMQTDVIRTLVKPGMKVLDIGANVGYYTLHMSELVGPTGRVTAFEPDVTNFHLLSRSVAELQIQNVVVVQAAVWDTTGELQLYVSETNPGDHQVYNADSTRSRYTIQSVTIDDYAPDARFDFIKMDIQGAEGHALMGMKKTLARLRPVGIIMEFWPSALSQAGMPPGDVFQILLDMGFTASRVDEDKGKVYPITLEQIMTYCDEDWKDVTLLCM